MTRKKQLLIFAAAFMLCAASGSQGQHQHTAPSQSWISIACVGVKQMAVGLGNQQPAITASSDQMTVVHHSRTLTVTVNGAEFKKRLGSAGFATDIYLIANENNHGLGSVRGEKSDAVVHTLVVDAAGTNAIWTESGVSWMAPFQTFNSTIIFHCSNKGL